MIGFIFDLLIYFAELYWNIALTVTAKDLKKVSDLDTEFPTASLVRSEPRFKQQQNRYNNKEQTNKQTN